MSPSHAQPGNRDEPVLSDTIDTHPPSPANSVLQALGAATPVQLREQQTVPPAPVDAPTPTVPVAAPGPRLQIHDEIARGGMGAVLRGRDVDLGREVAVKVLLETHAGHTELVQRFVEEAQISGQLQHPGIVPVYELGQFPAAAGEPSRPYFTMKLVKGQTQATLLQDRTEPAQDRPRLLKVFEQVCQTLAYAHARGVIHRDLKPANVMVGAFGEVQVMDWGLAKVLPDGRGAPRATPRPAPASVIHTVRSEDVAAGRGSPTQMGSVLGTPAYMPPEQARGKIDGLDERADVFGLGAILCEILTGQPPYVGRDRFALMCQAATAELQDAWRRLDGCGADGDLVTLAKRCLAAAPGQRPRHAGEVAEAVPAHLQSVEQRLRQAEVERARAEVQAGEERRRRLTGLLAAAVLSFVLLGAGGGLWLVRQHDQRRAEAAQQEAEQRRTVTSALEQAVALMQQAQWRPAQALLEQARLQALVWLQADLALWKKLAASAPDLAGARVQTTLQHWQRNPDLAGVRDKDALAKLPEAERQVWHKLWADVADLLRKSGVKQ
jgi:serine/threonine-protein kinase